MFVFEPDRVAYLEASGWRAYYERRWLRLLRLIVTLCQEQFHIPFPLSLLAAYYATRASIAWAPVQHDVGAVQAFYVRFYRLARRFSGLQFDPERAAALEVAYYSVHRELVGTTDKARFVDTLTQLHSTLFGLSPDQARASAEYRVRANTTVDRITSGRSADPAADWALIEADLRGCYRSIQARLPSRTPERDSPGAGRAYAFVTTWQVEAPTEAVWEAIFHAERWPDWWPTVAAVVEIVPGDAQGLGSVRRFTWTTRLPYRLTFDSRVTFVKPPYELEASATGQLVGTGRWRLTPTTWGTTVRYDWNVRTASAWMNTLAPLARPLFAWNHDAVMRAGGQGLGRLLRARVRG